MPTPIFTGFAALLVATAGLMLAGCNRDDRPAAVPPPNDSPPQARTACDLDAVAGEALAAINARDYRKLAALVHPRRGVRFSPYATVDPDTDRHFTPSQLAGAGSDKTVYNWGHYDGSGEPIELSIDAYFDRFVADKDYAAAPQRAVGKRLGHGNSIDNIAETYDDARVIEYHVPGENPDYGGMDWGSLRLVVADHDGCARLVGIVHDQWTI